jgi:hypothetical protein
MAQKSEARWEGASGEDTVHPKGSGRTHPQPEPKTASFMPVLVQRSNGTA